VGDVADDAPVPYQALYRRFRPQRFADVLGQEHVTRALKAAVRDGKVAHAYLFSGPRGTGKTSTARILAMALNCEHPNDGEPDGTCDSCVAIRQGASLDVQELDSATNRGIDEMRDLLSRVALGTPGRWKVYIVDEVHQMTSAASSALLKTLEEPPGHVIFVLATTDPQKVLETIRSRTQHFEFRLLASDVLTALLTDVAEKASLELPPEAIDLVVKRGHGSARDALSALDQVAAAGDVEEESSTVADLVGAIAERDAGEALVKVAEGSRAGLDPRRLGTELLEYLRNGFLATRAPSLVMLSEAEAAEAGARATKLGPAALVRAMEVVGQALVDMRDSADPRSTLEVALVRLAAPEVDDSRAALLERIERLERAVKQGGGSQPTDAPVSDGGPSAGLPSRASVGAAPPPPRATGGLPRPALGAHRPPGSARPAPPPQAPGTAAPPPGLAPQPAPTAPPRPEAAGDAPPSREELTLAWGDKILPALRPAIKAYVASGRFLPSEGGEAVYAVPDRGLLGRAQGGRAEVEAALTAHFGRPVPLRLVLEDAIVPGGAGQSALTASPEPGGAEDSGDFDPADLQDAPAAVMSPEQRLLEAFPGAEEVS
jgi:DNA polymerase-3 subunit gamma/tau